MKFGISKLVFLMSAYIYFLGCSSESTKILTYHEMCIKSCNKDTLAIDIKFQECDSLQLFCDNFDCLPYETPGQCFERQKEKCANLRICWLKYNKLVKAHKDCIGDCNKSLEVLYE